MCRKSQPSSPTPTFSEHSAGRPNTPGSLPSLPGLLCPNGLSVKLWPRCGGLRREAGTFHPPFRLGQRPETGTFVQSAARLLHQERAEPVPALGGVDEHVADPGIGRVVGDDPGESNLHSIGRVQADDERILDGPDHHLAGTPFGPVALAADPGMHAFGIDQVAVVACPVAVRSWPLHDRLPSVPDSRFWLPRLLPVPPPPRPPGGTTGSPGGGPSRMRRPIAAVSRCPAIRSPSTSSRASRTAAKSVPGATVKSLPASAATSVRKARRNASFSSVPCQLVPQTAPARQPSRNGSAPGWTVAIP